MNLKIQLSAGTVKALQEQRQQAYKAGDVRLVRRISVLLEVLQARGLSLQTAQQWKISHATIYNWVLALMQQGLNSLTPCWGGGRKAKLTPWQKQRLCQLLDAGPQAAGFSTACWSSLLVAELIEREFGVLYNRFYLCQLLRNLGYSFQKAQFVLDHLDPERREKWLQEEWPRILLEARQQGALLLFGDESSFAQWGSLSYTWSRKGHTPLVQTSGVRKACKVYGLIEFFSGRLFYEIIQGRFNSQSYCAFLQKVLEQTQDENAMVFVIQDGARYHTSKATGEFLKQHQERLRVFQLPSYSPDYNPIEYLWRNTKKATTHNKYFAQFESLTCAVEKTLAEFAVTPQAVLKLFGRYCQEANFPLQLRLAA